MGLLRGYALSWVEVTYSQRFVSTFTFHEFCSCLQEIFDHLDHLGNAGKCLLRPRQGQRSVADFSIEFRTLAADSLWNDAALRGVFLDAMSSQPMMNLLILMLLFLLLSG